MRQIIGCLVLSCVLLGCPMQPISTTSTTVTASDTALRTIIITQLALTGAYDTTGSLVQTHMLSVDAANDVVKRLDEARAALSSARKVVQTDPANALKWVEVASGILVDVAAKEGVK
jgi:cytochrome c-type biogenesis protein CcmH/NrfG